MAGTPALRPRFWERFALNRLSAPEWEALCDGCGKCCLNKLEDADTGVVEYTRVACRLFDDDSCRCAHYAVRKQLVPDCVVLTPNNIGDIAYWMPQTCAYRRLYEGKPLPDWHPLLTGTPESVHAAGMSMRGRTLAEAEVPVEDWEDHLLNEEP